MRPNLSPGIFAATMAITLAAVWSTSAGAQDTDPNSREILFSPYLWVPSLNGTSTVGALPPIEIDAGFSDLFANLNFAMALHTEFHNGPWAFVIDPMYVSVERDLDPGVPVPAGAGPKMGVDMWFVELWAGYRFADQWEALGGARYQSQDLDVSGLPSPLPIDSLSVSEDWTDWFVGVRFTADMNEKWFFAARADAVIAGDSDSSYNASVMFNRRFGPGKALNLGYRYFVDDYENLLSYAWDITPDGPLLGFTWAF